MPLQRLEARRQPGEERIACPLPRHLYVEDANLRRPLRSAGATERVGKKLMAEAGFPNFLRMRQEARTSRLEEVGRGLRRMMPWLESERKVPPT